jgi:Zn-dependent protease with chaperone function
MVRPNRTFTGLVAVSGALIIVIGWSTRHLLMAGAPGSVSGGPWPELQCLLIPGEQDRVTHLISYVFLAAIGASTASAVVALWRQQRKTRRLLRNCRAAQLIRDGNVHRLERAFGLNGRIDVVDSATKLAFCYGFSRPRVLLTTGLLASLSNGELESLLLHEREHVRQHDPLKVAVGRLLAAVLFFIPVIAALYRRYLVEKELAADQAAVEVQGHARDLASALLHLLEAAAPQSATTAGGAEALDARIAALLGEPLPSQSRLRPSRLAASLVVAILALLPLVTPLVHAAPSAAPDRDVVHGCHAARDVSESTVRGDAAS